MAPDPHLLAIIDDPTDLSRRLAYADALDERCDPRGRYVRLCVELATLPADPGCTADGKPGRVSKRIAKRRILLLREADALFIANAGAWLAGSPGGDFVHAGVVQAGSGKAVAGRPGYRHVASIGKTEFGFALGLPEAVAASHDDFLANVGRAFANWPIDAVAINNREPAFDDRGTYSWWRATRNPCGILAEIHPELFDRLFGNRPGLRQVAVGVYATAAEAVADLGAAALQLGRDRVEKILDRPLTIPRNVVY